MITKEQSLKIKKSLTEHKRYGELLYEIGKSREPLSSTQIEKGYAKAKTNPLKSAKYVHEMLKELCPTEYVIGDFLFIWEDLIENEESDEYKRGEYKRKLITKFNEVFGLKWHKEGGEAKQVIDLNNDHLIHFKLTKNSDKSEQLKIYYGQSDMIEIHLDLEKNRHRNAHMFIFDEIKDVTKQPEIKKTYKLTTERHNNKIRVYTLKYNPNTTRYLDVTLKPKIEKLMSDKRKQEGIVDNPSIISDIALADSFHDIREMRDNRGNWRYSLNLRGLLLYLYHENNSTDKKRKAKSRIRKVISNPLVIKKAKFLMFWKDFKKIGFNVFDLLLDIGREYKDQLHITIDVERQDNNYYMRRITERFSVELEGIFTRFFNLTDSAEDIKKIGSEEYNKILERINDYKARVFFSFQKDLIRKQLEHIEYYGKPYKFIELKKELDNAIDAAAKHDDNHIILIDKLAQKHEMSGEDVRDFINSVILRPSRQNEKRTGQRSSAHYFNYKDKQYLVVNSCLISIPKADKLKSLLFDGMDINDAYLVLDKHNIPKSFHYELVCKLGFGTESNSDYTGGYIVKVSR